MPKVIGIIGSRRRNTIEDYNKTLIAFEKQYFVGDTIVSGGCPKGGDLFAEVIAQRFNIDIKIHPAEWDKYGRGAGFKRNGLIALDADILIVVASDDRTGGTEDTIRKFTKLGKTQLILV